MTKRASISLCVAVVLCPASALAEPEPGSVKRLTSPETRSASPTAPQPSASATAHRAAVPSPAEARRHPIVRRATDMVDLLSLRADRVQLWLRDARGQQDRARSRCLDRVLSQSHALERQGDYERGAIATAVLRGEAWATAPRLQRLAVFFARSDTLLEAADDCGRQVSRTMPMPTRYQVRTTKPQLPDPERPPQQSHRSTTRRVAGPVASGDVQ